MAQWNARLSLETASKGLSESDKIVLERYGVFRRSTMPGSSLQQQFDAAVQLIRGLPKDGPFQPSNEMKLRLYGLYKQATEGPCVQPAPSFWDVIGKAKWGAWKNLADLPADRAMANYVEEIKQVMETMSLTDDVAALMDTLGPVYEYVDEEEAARPARKKHVHFSPEEATNGHGRPAPAGPGPEEQNGAAPAGLANGEPPLGQLRGGYLANGEPPQPPPERWAGSATSDTDDDEFSDPIGEAEAAAGRRGATEARLDALHHQLLELSRLVTSAEATGRVIQSGPSPPAGPGAATALPGPTVGVSSCPGVHDELRALVRDMRDDLDTVTGRLRRLEAAQDGEPTGKLAARPWWQVPELAPRSLLLLLAWPLLLQLALRLLNARRRR